MAHCADDADVDGRCPVKADNAASHSPHREFMVRYVENCG